MSYGGFEHGGQRRWRPLGEYEANEHITRLAASGLSLSAYCRQNSVQRNALAEAIKSFRPELYDGLVGKSADSQRTGTKFEYGVKSMLERRGYYVIRQYGSKSPIDLLAVGKDKPVLFVQVKKDGKLYFNDWNAVYDLAVEHGGWPVLAAKAEPRGALWYRLMARKEKKGQRNDGLLEPFDPRDPLQVSLLAPAAA